MAAKEAAIDEIKALGFSRFLPEVHKKKGKPPGTIHYTGKERKEEATIDIIDYTKISLEEKSTKKVEDAFPYKDKKSVTWINVNGVHDISILEKLGANLGLHPLILEDIANVNQRPKVEDYDKTIFVVLKMLAYNEKTKAVHGEQLGLILQKNTVVSFQEQEGDVFNPVRERIRKGRKVIRSSGSDYLLYALIDGVVDHYFSVLEKVGEGIEELEKELITRPQTKTQADMYRIKRELILLRKSVWPLREVIGSLHRNEMKIISKQTKPYFRDTYDHTIQVIDTIETFRDLLSGMLDSYLSAISNKMNETMKVLTIIATVFIPLTFIAGIYGMNFEFMPELKIWWFYPLVWLVMIVLVGFMLFYFRRKRWI
ncbi:MAG: magnesium/cobalt transporter CorA [Nanoarchaeota archaeon]|nr:magnesium/cobalt transporter CorA [Nanoarchaeota archaeon]